MTVVSTPSPPAETHAHLSPRRVLAVLTFVTSFGNGLYLTVGVLFFTRTLGFGAGRVGLVLSLAGLAGVLATVPAGRCADRWGVKPVLAVLTAAEAVAVGALAFCTTFAAFVVVICLATGLDRGAAAVRQALYAVAFDPATRVADRAYIRAVTNVAIGLGAAAAGIALQIDSRVWYQALIVVDGFTFLAVPAVLPRVRILQAEKPASAGVSQKVPIARIYLAVSALNAVLMMQFAVAEVGLPLWLLQDTRAPRVLVSALLIVNTVLVVLFQVRATRGVDGPASAARAVRRSGLALAATCLVAALAQGVPGPAAAVILLASIVLMTIGEVLSQAGAWSLSYDLADDRAVGAYQGAFHGGVAAGQMVGPVVITQTALRHGFAGWTMLAAVFAVAGALMVPVARRAAITGTHDSVMP